ncbi:alpha/beta hydrolase [Paracoccus sp. YLB-12]|uniref:Alpha/beta hydrolase n=1 Tax=Paracoccus maritimus TaxID=2933292 RepID=A0ABT2K5M6_9RHOB|nr:alpha/beta hydrolase [Paracoccus sp. YLB-12]MCT4331823.1 alpha/beta hydrolase [Paracoccus sp. YLB-12]
MHELHFKADPAGKPALLLVHGILSSRGHWALNTDLPRHYRCIRVDLPAHGNSLAPDDPFSCRPGDRNLQRGHGGRHDEGAIWS